jgi:hypothetical protein
VLTHEHSPLDPGGGIQTKFHAPGVGIAKVGALNDPEGETLVLRESIQLDEESMAAARSEALKLDQRGFRVSGVYCETEPIAPNPATPCSAQPTAPSTGSVPPGGTQQVAPAPGPPAAPVAPGPKTHSRAKSCYAKRSRDSARRRARRSLLKKLARKTCAERLSRR